MLEIYIMHKLDASYLAVHNSSKIHIVYNNETRQRVPLPHVPTTLNFDLWPQKAV